MIFTGIFIGLCLGFGAGVAVTAFILGNEMVNILRDNTDA